MGSGRNYNPEGGFKTYNWQFYGETIDGVKIIYNKPGTEGPDGLPYHSGASKAYFKKVKGEIVQLRLYKNRRAFLDIDINPLKPHNHKGKNYMPAGITHVHEWIPKKEGGFRRNKYARFLSDQEIKDFGDLLEKANSNVRYRP